MRSSASSRGSPDTLRCCLQPLRVRGSARAMAEQGGEDATTTVAIIGSGLIGRSWAMLFAAAGFPVRLYDSLPGVVEKALQAIRENLNSLAASGSLRGSLPVDSQLSLIQAVTNLSEAVSGVDYVQECIPEDVSMKKELYRQLDPLLGPGTVLASSTSCLLPSALFAERRYPANCLVCHPVNPPYFVRLVELVPHPGTSGAALSRAHALMTRLGQAPVTLRREIPGFALNRVQYAIIAEAWRLVRDGVMSPEDVDLVMTEGLGPRYAFVGPLETMHLNAEGFKSYCERYQGGMTSIMSAFGPLPNFAGEALDTIDQAMSARTPANQEALSARRKWRDERLTELAKMKSAQHAEKS